MTYETKKKPLSRKGGIRLKKENTEKEKIVWEARQALTGEQ